MEWPTTDLSNEVGLVICPFRRQRSPCAYAFQSNPEINAWSIVRRGLKWKRHAIHQPNSQSLVIFTACELSLGTAATHKRHGVSISLHQSNGIALQWMAMQYEETWCGLEWKLPCDPFRYADIPSKEGSCAPKPNTSEIKKWENYLHILWTAFINHTGNKITPVQKYDHLFDDQRSYARALDVWGVRSIECNAHTLALSTSPTEYRNHSSKYDSNNISFICRP